IDTHSVGVVRVLALDASNVEDKGVVEVGKVDLRVAVLCTCPVEARQTHVHASLRVLVNTVSVSSVFFYKSFKAKPGTGSSACIRPYVHRCGGLRA
ncbi:UNVERIFIED_CONTAM: hypothetical protein HDU68_007541, partial [Siphonaria sp. JEL0065]